MFNTCARCGVVLIPNKGTKTNFCKDCSTLGKSDVIGIPNFISKVFLKDYGHVEQSRLNELDRRAIIPGSLKPDGTYKVGRRGEDGKIHEKEPNY